ncbi:dihydrolipoyl dehydrogenase family protein [Megalodesulfovibrio gigas]|uniref:Putative FAD-dependent pyridine nucleotide-disulfide oxidoreductase n=1 Tax=Megalodesulfovibrio gigas (strain ATCC 19364 / DSM 1382 / NCIMB 9332 / VKM B-1759) TaxID=1121448 RepID=T2GCA6_MEGG1|nr:FAD-dependent oxidoreductase [Megalodesulfovibrio gigas]AGW13933.1 putative FAD-dependent pyridine nucleotide-disulfide oxidoreductase [Megalodesulfovibrio gigas DSM 1382 = ATCC 19364]
MPAFEYDLGIIGGGAAGLTVASGAAQMGAKTLLVERREALGGDCLHFGCVPSKTLIKSAHVYHLMQQGAAFGLPVMDPGPVEFARVRERIRGVIAAIQPHDSVERFCGLGAQIKFGQAEFLDEHSIRLHGKTIAAERWVIAAGARPAIPDIPGLEAVAFHTNETIFFMDSLPSSLLVLGGGPIAIELAQAFQRLGSRVTVIQRSPQILSREDADMAALIRQRLEAEGVRVITGVATTAVRETCGLKEVVVSHKDGREEVISGTHLLVALGRQANVDTMGLDNAGVAFSARGVQVDARLRTSQDHIYACGDITGAWQFTHAAGYEGGVVLANAIFRLPRKADYTWMPRATYTDPELACLGLTEAQCIKDGIEHRVLTEEFQDNDRALAEGAGVGRLKLIVDRKEKPLGVQICGPNAGELLGEWSAVLGGGVKLSTLAGTVHAYPTLAEINKKVAGALIAPKIFGGLVKKGVNFLFNYKGRACEWTSHGEADPPPAADNES